MPVYAEINSESRAVVQAYCSSFGVTKRVSKIYVSNAGKTVGVWSKPGTELNPYRIASVSDLFAIENSLSAHYKLTKDITVSGGTSIGSSTAPFNGTFDGNGYKISISTSKPNRIDGNEKLGGIFGVNRGTIKNLKVNDVSLSNYSPDITCSSVVCADNRGFIDHCCGIIGQPFAKDSNSIFGIIAAKNSGHILNCYANMQRAENNSTRRGGVAGTNTGEILTSVSRMGVGTMNGDSTWLGALAYRNDGTIKTCYWNAYMVEPPAVRIGTVTDCKSFADGISDPGRFPGLDFEKHWTFTADGNIALIGLGNMWQ